MTKTQIITYWSDLPWKEVKLKANKYLPKLIFVILILLITKSFAELTWTMFSPAQPSTVSFKAPTMAANLSSASANLSEVSQYHLFGNAKKQIISPTKMIDAPETRLRLNLKGVFASNNAAEALAIISSNKGKDETYHIGDKITGSVILHAVYADRVILKRGGQLETLRLPKSKVDSKSFYSKSPSSSTVSQSNVLSQSSTQRSNSQRLRKLRDTLLNDPAKLWQQIRINPVMTNGKIKGYTLSHNDPALMKALNIRRSDVIIAINGQSLSDPSTLYGLMNGLSEQQSMELKIERNGQQQTVQLNF